MDARSAPAKTAETGGTGGARALVLLLGLAWGFNWIAAAIAIPETPPWSLRFAGLTIGSATLVIAAWLSGRSLYVPKGQRLHIAVAGFFNVAAFNMLSLFAQMSGTTSRAIIVNYSMPIWMAVMAWVVLGERLNKVRGFALMLCVSGLAILMWPLIAKGFPTGVLFALASAWAWGIATIYLKWAKVDVDPLINAAWQLVFGWVLITAGMLIVDGSPHLFGLQPRSQLAILYIGLFGVGLAHYLWWSIVGKLSAVTASIGSLLVPVVGVISSTLVLGERPTLPDIIGFVLIFSAAACVLLLPNTPIKDEFPE
ncbi:MAG TPA: DMT family transporter [Pseudolabrys sp.]|nr:DMT family transporter [Pseudolabrys sp.]